MIVSSDLAPRLFGIVAVAALVAACAGNGAGSGWTAAPVASATPTAPSTAPPVASASIAPPPATAIPAPTTTSEPPPAPSPQASSQVAAGITDAEFSTLTGGTGERGMSFDPPPGVSREQAEATVRAQFPGARPLIWSGLVAFGDPAQHGWMIVLGPAPGQPCDLHAGLLDRALEGGIVDATAGDLEWTYRCG